MDENGEYHACNECDWRKSGEWHKCTRVKCSVWHRPPTEEEEANHYNALWNGLERWGETDVE